MITKYGAIFTCSNTWGLINVFASCMQKLDIITKAVLPQCMPDSSWLVAQLIKVAHTEHFKRREVIKFCAKSGNMEIFSEDNCEKLCDMAIILHWQKRFPERSNWHQPRFPEWGTPNFRQLLAGSSLSFKVHCSRIEKRWKFALHSIVAKLDADFYENV